MKLNFQFVTVLGSVGINLAAADCDTNTLTEPDHFQGWQCDSSPDPNGIVTVGTRCKLECEERFTPFSDRKRDFYVCRNLNIVHPTGWRPNDLNLSCKYDRK